MIKTLKEIQEENRRAIIMACNSTAKSYKEALEIEAKHPHCYKIFTTEYGEIKTDIDPIQLGYNRKKHHPDCFLKEIIGKPLTLDRVLITIQSSSKWLGFSMNCHGDMEYEKLNKTNKRGEIININWDLTKPTLEEQTEETQRAINTLIYEQN